MRLLRHTAIAPRDTPAAPRRARVGRTDGPTRTRASAQRESNRRRLHDLRRRPLRKSECRRRGVREAIVVDIEAAAQPKAPIQHERADKGACPIPGRLHHRRQRRHVFVQSKRDVVVDAVASRRESREDGGVRRQRHGHVRGRAGIAQTLGGEAIECRRQACRTAVGTDAIPTERVDRDEEHVRARQLATDERGCRARCRARGNRRGETGAPHHPGLRPHHFF